MALTPQQIAEETGVPYQELKAKGLQLVDGKNTYLKTLTNKGINQEMAWRAIANEIKSTPVTTTTTTTPAPSPQPTSSPSAPSDKTYNVVNPRSKNLNQSGLEQFVREEYGVSWDEWQKKVGGGSLQAARYAALSAYKRSDYFGNETTSTRNTISNEIDEARRKYGTAILTSREAYLERLIPGYDAAVGQKNAILTKKQEPTPSVTSAPAPSLFSPPPTTTKTPQEVAKEAVFNRAAVTVTGAIEKNKPQPEPILGVHDEEKKESRLVVGFEKTSFLATSGGESIEKPKSVAESVLPPTKKKTEVFVVKGAYEDTLNKGGTEAFTKIEVKPVVPKSDSLGNLGNDFRAPMERNEVLPEAQGFAARVERAQERKQEFLSSEGVKRMELAGSILSLGGGRPIETRHPVAQVYQNVVTGAISWPIMLGGGGISAGETIGATIEGVARKDSRQNVWPELGRAGMTTLTTTLNPTTVEGASTYASAALFALPGAAGAQLSGKGGFGPDFAKLRFETVNIPTKTPSMDFVSVKGLEVRSSGTIDVPVPKTGFSPPTHKFTTFGIDAGTRSVTLITKGFEGLQIGRFSPKTKISLENIGEVPQPTTSLGGKVFNKALDLTPMEQARIREVVNVGRVLGKEKGMRVEEAFFNVEGLKNPSKASKVIEQAVAKDEGVFFGSGTTQQLPKGYQTLKPGDVDVIYPRLTTEQLTPKIAELAKRLQGIGEKVRVSGENPKVIEFTETRGKLFEAKSGIDEGMRFGEETAPTGFLGFKFPDLKSGKVGKTVEFGEARAITAGEQFLRKGSASLVVRGPTSDFVSRGYELVPESFQGAGVLGKGYRGVKDIAGLLQSGKGLVVLRSERPGVIRSYRTAKADAALNRYFETFTPEQRGVIMERLSQTTGTEAAKFRLVTSKDVYSDIVAKSVVISFKTGGASYGFTSPYTTTSVFTSKVVSPYTTTSVFPRLSLVSQDASVISIPSSSTIVSPSSVTSVPVPSIAASSMTVSRTSSFLPSSSSFTSPVVTTSQAKSSSSYSPVQSTFISKSNASSASSIISPGYSPSTGSLGSSSGWLGSSLGGSPSTSSIISPSSSYYPRSSTSSIPSVTSSFSSIRSSYYQGSSSSYPSSTTTRQPTPPRTPPGRIKMRRREKDWLFDVAVRRRGKFEVINTKGLKLEQAVSLGKRRVESTAAASFKIIPRSKSYDVKAYDLNLGGRFRASKKDPLVAVERSRYRISTGGEKAEITAKGILATKKKRRGLF